MSLIAKAQSLLSLPFFYNSLHVAIGIPRQRRILVREFVRPQKNDRILDIGCGPAEILGHLKDFEVSYTGIEPEEAYLEYAIRRWSREGRYEFRVAAIKKGAPPPVAAGSFDIVLAFGVMHHLTDDEVCELVKLAAHCLRPGGRLVTMDPCRFPDMNLVEKFMVKYDRGLYIRNVPAYAALVQTAFQSVKHAEKAMNYLPYRAVVFECQNGRPAASSSGGNVS